MNSTLIKDYDSMAAMYHNIGFALDYLDKFRDEFDAYCRELFRNVASLHMRLPKAG